MKLPPTKLIFSSIFHSIIGCSGWYHYTVLNSLEPFIKTFANESISTNYGLILSKKELAFVWSVVTTIFLIGGICGSLMLNFLTEKLGRRNTVMVVKNVMLIFGSLMLYSAKSLLSIELLVLGRFVCGAASSLNFFIAVFISECAPTAHRGLASAISALGLQLWGVFGTVAALPHIFGSEAHWPLALALPILPAILHLFGTPFISESPKFLYIAKKDEQRSASAVKFYHGSRVNLQEIHFEYEQEMRATEEGKSVTLKTIFKSRHLRWPLILGLVASLSIAADGSDIAYQYSTGVMMSSFSVEKAAVFTVLLVQLPSLLAALLGMTLLEIVGRRPLFLSGLAFCAFGALALFISGLIQSNSPDTAAVLNVLGLVLILGGDSFGPTIIRTFLAGELCPQMSRSLSAAVDFIAEDISSTIVTLYFPPMAQLVGSYAILPFTILSSASFLFLYAYLPETKNKTVHEVIKRWVKEESAEETALNREI